METNAILLTSSDPLPNRMLKIRKLYWLCLASMILGLVIEFFLGVGLLGFMVVYIIHNIVLSYNTGLLRGMKFRYGNLTVDELFPKLQTALLAQYQGAVLMERNQEKGIVLTFDGHIYDLNLNEDGTFSLWWRMSAGRAFFSLNEYKSYRKLLVGYGVLGYHIQQCCELTEKV